MNEISGTLPAARPGCNGLQWLMQDCAGTGAKKSAGLAALLS
jgi:hypothetical protein